MGILVGYEQEVQLFVGEDRCFQNYTTFHGRFAESASQVRKPTSAAAVPNQAGSSELRPPAERHSMAPGHVTPAAVAPLIALENEMLNMISALHLAFRRLASKSKASASPSAV